MVKKISLVLSALFMCIVLSSCGSLGWSVVLWNNPEAGVSEGQIVKVFVKSNISHTYIIGIPETRKKVEIPLWQISEPQGKGKTGRLAEKYSAFEHTYASVKLDGLPIRAGTENGAKQVYRLRKNEVIRVLYQGKGVKPTNGHGELPGEWLRVLTGTGTLGWCYSYNLNLFDRIDNNLAAKDEVVEEEADERLNEALAKHWCPELYSTMLSTGRYDLNKLNAEYGFFFGWALPTVDEEGNVVQPPAVNVHTVAIRTHEINRSWNYEKINKTDDDVYQFDDLQVIVTLKGKHSMAVQYMDTDGKMKNENFVAIDRDIQEVIDEELMRRQDELKAIAEAGPVFRSSNYGTIKFNNENSVTWQNYQLLVPAIVSSSALGSVTVTVENYLSNNLKADFDGILTFHFMGMEKAVNFFYKMDDGGIRLEDAARAQYKDNLVISRGPSPLVMFFSAK